MGYVTTLLYSFSLSLFLPPFLSQDDEWGNIKIKNVSVAATSLRKEEIRFTVKEQNKLKLVCVCLGNDGPDDGISRGAA